MSLADRWGDDKPIQSAIEVVNAESVSPAWWDLVGRFRAAGAELEQWYAKLSGDAEFARARPALAGQFETLMGRAAQLRATIAQTLSGIDASLGWLRSVGLGSLGALPIIGVAVIAAALAAVTKWVVDARVFSQKLDAQRRLEASGVDPVQAWDTVNRGAQLPGILGGVFGDAAKWLPLLIVLGIGAVVWQKSRR